MEKGVNEQSKIYLFLSGFEDKVVVSRMAKKINLQAVSSLFAVQFSERSGLVKDVKAVESILREYETATTTRFSCFKANKGFGNTGERFSSHKIGTLSTTKNVFRFALFSIIFGPQIWAYICRPHEKTRL